MLYSVLSLPQGLFVHTIFEEGYQQYLRTIKVCAYTTDEATLQEKCDLLKTWLSESCQRIYAGSEQAHDLHDSNIRKHILPSLLDSNDRIRARIRL